MLVSLFELGGQAREDIVSAAYTHDLSPKHCVQLADLWSGLRTRVRAVGQGRPRARNAASSQALTKIKLRRHGKGDIWSDIKKRHLCHVNAYDEAVELI